MSRTIVYRERIVDCDIFPQLANIQAIYADRTSYLSVITHDVFDNIIKPMLHTYVPVIYVVRANGDQEYRTIAKPHKLHRSGDQPAFTSADGTKKWYKHGQNARENDKPTTELYDGTLIWQENDKPHRSDDKPAFITADGTKLFYQRGKLHRTCGPARMWANGEVDYWQNDCYIAPTRRTLIQKLLFV